MRFYPGEFREGNIPWLWFQYLLKYMPNIRALEQSRHIAESAVGFAGGESADQVLRDLSDQAMKRR